MSGISLTRSGFTAHVWAPVSKFGLATLLLLGLCGPANGQSNPVTEPPDSTWAIELPLMVVTATRTAVSLRDVPIPTKVILSEQIRKLGVLRISDLLAEETGLLQVHYFGSGIQLQGFDSEYTLILIDGQPVIGRQGGTLDLDRFAVSDIESVEIVQGPSSSLYGSEALAGVINLITRRAESGFQFESGQQIQTNGTFNTTVGVRTKLSDTGLSLNYDRLSSNGYDLSPDVVGLTGPGYTTHTFSGRMDHEWSSRLKMHLNARLASQKQSNVIGFDQSGVKLTFDETTTQEDWSLSPEISWRPSLKHRFVASAHLTDFATRMHIVDDLGPSDINFQQDYRKSELQHHLILGSSLLINSGIGLIGERVEADRLSGVSRSNTTSYGFAQQQWFPVDVLQVTTSARVDHHSDYGTRFTPKAALMYKPEGSLRLRASVGSGFKAPSFQQLYMDFTNAVAGYSVVGAADIDSALRELESLGQISNYLSDPSLLKNIRPESSVAYNFSTDFDLGKRTHFHVTLFRNNVRDLIETLPIAAKPNGQHVYTYVNLNQIYTQGVTTEIRYRLHSTLDLVLGYQFLSANDRTVLQDIKDGNLFGRRKGQDFRLTKSDYGGLFNRSKHSGTIQLSWNAPDARQSVRIRGSLRSRYGFGDLNGNLVLDSDAEYVNGYSLWNVTYNRLIGTRLTLQSGINNLFGYTNTEYVPSLSGRQFFAGLSFSIN